MRCIIAAWLTCEYNSSEFLRAHFANFDVSIRREENSPVDFIARTVDRNEKYPRGSPYCKTLIDNAAIVKQGAPLTFPDF